MKDESEKRMAILDRKQSDDLLRECGHEPKVAKPAVDDVCQCPKCGRMHRNLGFGRPPRSHVPVTLAELEALLAEPDKSVEVLLDGTVRPLSQPATPAVAGELEAL